MEILWVRDEAGYYSAQAGSKPIAICREADRRWHVYIERAAPPGDSKHDTLAQAKAWCEQRFADQ